MKDCVWVIKVTFPNGEVNFNEGYLSFDKCKSAILNKNKYTEHIKTINDYIFKDLDSEIIYEIKCVTIF